MTIKQQLRSRLRKFNAQRGITTLNYDKAEDVALKVHPSLLTVFSDMRSKISGRKRLVVAVTSDLHVQIIGVGLVKPGYNPNEICVKVHVVEDVDGICAAICGQAFTSSRKRNLSTLTLKEGMIEKKMQIDELKEELNLKGYKDVVNGVSCRELNRSTSQFEEDKEFDNRGRLIITATSEHKDLCTRYSQRKYRTASTYLPQYELLALRKLHGSNYDVLGRDELDSKHTEIVNVVTKKPITTPSSKPDTPEIKKSKTIEMIPTYEVFEDLTEEVHDFMVNCWQKADAVPWDRSSGEFDGSRVYVQKLGEDISAVIICKIHEVPMNEQLPVLRYQDGVKTGSVKEEELSNVSINKFVNLLVICADKKGSGGELLEHVIKTLGGSDVSTLFLLDAVRVKQNDDMLDNTIPKKLLDFYVRHGFKAVRSYSVLGEDGQEEKNENRISIAYKKGKNWYTSGKNSGIYLTNGTKYSKELEPKSFDKLLTRMVRLPQRV
jgi:hypothetical protein